MTYFDYGYLDTNRYLDTKIIIREDKAAIFTDDIREDKTTVFSDDKDTIFSDVSSEHKTAVFSCLKCEKFYKNKYYLSQHVRHECGKVPRHHCPYCSLRTHRKYNLNKHIRNIHKGMPLLN